MLAAPPVGTSCLPSKRDFLSRSAGNNDSKQALNAQDRFKKSAITIRLLRTDRASQVFYSSSAVVSTALTAIAIITSLRSIIPDLAIVDLKIF
jgi:hypothetical protein